MNTMQYDYEVSNLWTGGNYGNLETFARTSAKTNLYGLWSSVDDQHYCGKWHIIFYAEGERLHSQRTLFAPAHQTTVYPSDEIEVTKTFFLPYWDGYRRVAYFVIKMRNFSDTEKSVAAVCDIEYPEFHAPDYTKLPDLSQKRKRVHSELVDGKIISRTEGRENEVRVIGSTAALEAQFFSPRGASLTYQIVAGPHEEREVGIIMVLSNEGAEVALAKYPEVQDYRRAFEITYETIDRLLATTDILVPDATINRSLKWAKINIIREEKIYPHGLGFTNDPPQDVLVVRDAAWFAVGADYLTPAFSKGMLRFVKNWGIEEGGKLTEYILACETPPTKYDYGLNINDDTPLYIWSVWHHFAVTRDRSFLEEMYPVAKQAMDWILAQRRGGLIYTSSEEANVWGISGWRNIIPEYQISGAVTEINAESYIALEASADLAKEIGDRVNEARYREAAQDLKKEINTRLVSPRTGVYLLNIAPDESRRDLLSGDLVFPVMFGVAEDGLESKILDTLNQPEFWTDYGVRTVPKGQEDYDPEFGVRLMGGIWPNLTAWVAYANREHHPERMVEAMHNIYRISEAKVPRVFKNAVPGQFPECLHGDNFQSRGMTLSPWMPPTYLWLAVEGLLGVEPGIGERLVVNPNPPPDWHWMAVRSLPFNDYSVSFFWMDGKLYSTGKLRTSGEQEVYEEDVSDLITSDAYTIAFRRGDETVVFVGSDARQGVRLEISETLTGGKREVIELILNPGEAKTLRITREGAKNGDGSAGKVGSGSPGGGGHRGD